MEKIILRRLEHLARLEGWISWDQFGGQRSCGSEHAAFRLSNAIYSAFKKREEAVAAFLDVSGAFNEVWQDAVLYSLIRKQCPTQYVSLLSSFLRDRAVMIKAGDEIISKTLTCSVPQGGVLSPFLFLVFFSPLFVEVRASGVDVTGFVDDVALCCSGGSREALQRHMNRALSIVVEWAKKFKLKFNYQKCNAILFSNTRKKRKILLQMEDYPLQFVNKVKYLGITFDRKLTWSSHLRIVCSRASSLLRKLRAVSKLKWGLNYESMRFLYLRAIQPMLLYGAAVWAPAMNKTTYINMIRKVQRLAALSVTGCLRTVSSDAVFVLADLIPIDYLVNERAALFFHRMWTVPSLRNRLNLEVVEQEHLVSVTHESSYQYCTKMSMGSYNNLPVPEDEFHRIDPPSFDYEPSTILNAEDAIKLANDALSQPGLCIFTDASKFDDSEVGFAAVQYMKETDSYEVVGSGKIDKEKSVFQGECMAVGVALDNLLIRNIEPAVGFPFFLIPGRCCWEFVTLMQEN